MSRESNQRRWRRDYIYCLTAYVSARSFKCTSGLFISLSPDVSFHPLFNPSWPAWLLLSIYSGNQHATSRHCPAALWLWHPACRVTAGQPEVSHGFFPLLNVFSGYRCYFIAGALNAWPFSIFLTSFFAWWKISAPNFFFIHPLSVPSCPSSLSVPWRCLIRQALACRSSSSHLWHHNSGCLSWVYFISLIIN